jgi:uncharacterized lipoprotein
MRFVAPLCLTLGLATIGACSRDEVARCEPPDRYATARSVAPVQIPDDLSPPDETDALRLPPVAPSPTDPPSAGCLEAPPPFFDTGRPGIEPDPEPVPSAEEPVAAPEPAGDRVIDN